MAQVSSLILYTLSCSEAFLQINKSDASESRIFALNFHAHYEVMLL